MGSYANGEIAAFIENITNLSPATQSSLIFLIICIAVLWLLRVLLIKIVMWQTPDPRKRYTWRKTISYIAIIIIIFLLARVFFRNLHSIATFLGLLTAALTIALRDVIFNVAAWFFILWRRPFEVGDRIQIGDQSGDVIDIHAFHFTLMEIGNWVDADQSTGRIIHIPNGQALSQPLANFTQEFHYIWHELPVLVTFESNWKKAKDILLQIVEKDADKITEDAQRSIRAASEKYMLFYKNLTPTIYTSVNENGILLTIRYLVEPRHRRGSEQAIWEDILYQFGTSKDIDFAYPTTRFYQNLQEGKPGTRPDRKT